jgi:hypothetical protein
VTARARVLRELAILSRQPAVPVAVTAVAVPLAAFVLAWPYGLPIASDSGAYGQTRALASLLLCVILPWATMRAAVPKRDDATDPPGGVLDAKTPSFVGARVFAHTVGLTLIVLTAYPPLLMAAHAAAVPTVTTIIDALALTGIAVLAAGLAAACTLLVPDRLAAWALATLLSMLIVLVSWRVAPYPAMVGATSGVVGVTVILAAAAWDHSSLVSIRSGDA